MTTKSIEDKVRNLGPWFHQIDLGNGVRTRDISASEGPQKPDHPADRWVTFGPEVPEDLNGAHVLDMGCADGFFSIELARRGAHVTAVDAWPAMVKRLLWAVETLGLSERVEAHAATVEDFEPRRQYDFCFFLGVLYHVQNPLLALSKVAATSNKIYLESATTEGDEPYLYLKPPQEGVHHVAKWFPTRSCIEGMLAYVGFDQVRFLDEKTRNRASLIAEKSA